MTALDAWMPVLLILAAIVAGLVIVWRDPPRR